MKCKTSHRKTDSLLPFKNKLGIFVQQTPGGNPRWLSCCSHDFLSYSDIEHYPKIGTECKIWRCHIVLDAPWSSISNTSHPNYRHQQLASSYRNYGHFCFAELSKLTEPGVVTRQSQFGQSQPARNIAADPAKFTGEFQRIENMILTLNDQSRLLNVQCTRGKILLFNNQAHKLLNYV